MPDERDMVRFKRLAAQIHFNFMREPVAFLIVAFDAGADHIFPRIIPSFGSRRNVIDREGQIGTAAVLAPVVIPAQYIFP